MKNDSIAKRWNHTFIFDKVLPIWVYRAINSVMYIWDLWYYIILLIARLKTTRNKKNKKYYISICAIFKDEALVLEEWIEFHKLAGVDHIYLYNNNTTDNSLEILRPYLVDGYITLIDWPHLPPCQAEAYNHFKANYWDETSWVAFIDLDEFICPKQLWQIKDWLKQYEGYPSLVVYWKMFGSSGLIEHDKSKLLIEQYSIAWDKLSDIGKPIFNTRFKSVPTTLKHIHLLPAQVQIFGVIFEIPPINEFRYFIKFRSNRTGWFRSQNDFTMQINHYATKAYNEYFIRRRQRGDVNGFANNTSVRAYQYVQEFSIKPDYTILRFLPFLKVRISGNDIPNYFD